MHWKLLLWLPVAYFAIHGFCFKVYQLSDWAIRKLGGDAES